MASTTTIRSSSAGDPPVQDEGHQGSKQLSPLLSDPHVQAALNLSDQAAESVLSIPFVKPYEKQKTGEVPLYVYCYDRAQYEEQEDCELDWENKYEFMSRMAQHYDTVQNVRMEETKVLVKNARMSGPLCGGPTHSTGGLGRKDSSAASCKSLQPLAEEEQLFTAGFRLVNLFFKDHNDNVLKDDKNNAIAPVADVNGNQQLKTYDETESFVRSKLLPAALSAVVENVGNSLKHDQQGHAHNREETTSWEPVHAGIFDFTFRNSKPVDGFPGGAPAPQAHCDFSKESGLTRMKRVLEGKEAAQHTWTSACANVAQEQDEGSSFGVSGGIRSPSNCFFNTEKQFRDFVYHELPMVSEKTTSTTASSGSASDYRICFLNVWAPLGDVIGKPLVVGDVRSFKSVAKKPTSAEGPDMDNLYTQEMYFKEDDPSGGQEKISRTGKVYIVAHGGHQDWYYYPHMKFGEALMFRTWDSHGKPSEWSTPHSGATDVEETRLGFIRKSVEIRCYVILKKNLQKEA